MNYRSTDENGNSPSVLGEAPQRQRKQRVSSSKAYHDEPHSMDSERACHEGLTKTNSKYSVTAAKHMRCCDEEGSDL